MIDSYRDFKTESQVREYIDKLSHQDFNLYAFAHGLSVDFIRQLQYKFNQNDQYWHDVFGHGLFTNEKQLKEFWGKMWCWSYFYRKESKKISKEFRQRYKQLIDQGTFKEWVEEPDEL